MKLRTGLFVLFVIAGTVWPGRSQEDPNPAVFPPEIRQIDPGFAWPVSMRDSAISRITSDAVGRLAVQFFGDDSKIDDVKFAFVQMDHGFPVLAIRYRVDGQEPAMVQFVRCEGITCRSQDVYSSGFDELRKEFSDFRGGGCQDFIAAQPIDPGFPGVMVFRVYRMRDGNMQDVSHGEEPIAHRLALLVDDQSKEISALLAGNDLLVYHRKMSIELLKAQDQYAREDYQRMVLGNVTAGFQHAELWKNAADFDIRKLAVDTFEAIANREAIAEVATLTKASDERTAEYASSALERINLRRTGRNLDGTEKTPLESKDK